MRPIKTPEKNTPASADIEHDAALKRIEVTLLKDDTQLFKQFFENKSFRRFVTDRVRDLNRAA